MKAANITIGYTKAFSTHEVLEFYSGIKKSIHSSINNGYTTDVEEVFDSLLGGIPKTGLTIIDGNRYITDFLQTLFFKFVTRKELNCVYFSLKEKVADLSLVKQIEQGSSELIQKFKALNPIFIEGSLISDGGDIEELFDQPSYEGAEVIFLDSLNNIYNVDDTKDELIDFIGLIKKINTLAKKNNMCIIATLHRKEKKNPLSRYLIKDVLIEHEEAYEMLLFLKGYRDGYIGTVYQMKATKPNLHYYAYCFVVGDTCFHNNNIEFDEFFDIDTAIKMSWYNLSGYEKWQLYKEAYKQTSLK